jgi:hypothetical protein
MTIPLFRVSFTAKVDRQITAASKGKPLFDRGIEKPVNTEIHEIRNDRPTTR